MQLFKSRWSKMADSGRALAGWRSHLPLSALETDLTFLAKGTVGSVRCPSHPHAPEPVHQGVLLTPSPERSTTLLLAWV